MTDYSPVPLRFKPGIQRDGTRLAAPGNWIDGKWTRFNRGVPRKMGGFFMLTESADGIQRSFENYMNAGQHFLHMGSNSSLRQMIITDAGISGSPSTRTPGSLTMSGDELWQMGTIYDPITNNSATLIAHAGRNLLDISNSTATPIYQGPSTATTALTTLSGLTSVSGGICVVKPYLTFFGSEGYFAWTGPNKPNDMTVASGGGAANVTAQKIVAGRSIRGGNGPSALYWSLDSLIRTSFVGGTPTWAYDTVAEDISVMSSRCMASFGDSEFYWLGQNSFYIYDGTARELPNNTNANFLFDNINRTYRQKCFTFVDQRWNEVWFCFPFGSSTECNQAVIFNRNEQVWYDTRLPSSGRGGAVTGTTYRFPIMSGVDAVSGSYRIWQHDTGEDEVRGSTIVPIQAYIESSDITTLLGDNPSNSCLSCTGVEPDITQSGDMSLTITGNANARSEDKDSETINFSPGPVDSSSQILRPKVERRQMRFRWESNTPGGMFEFGVPIAHMGEGTSRETG